MSEPKYQVGQRVHVSSVTSRRIEGIIVDRVFDGDTEYDPGEWFYSLDGKNYLNEQMVGEI